ncbi:hypothetical protein ACFX1Q_035492 [Malus domestica]
MLFAFSEKPLGLYDPSFDENSRGVGFVAKLFGERSSLLLKDFSTLDIKDDEKPKCGKKKSGCVVQMAHFSVLFFGMDQHHRGGRLPLLQIPIPEIPPPTQKLPRHHTAMSKINPEVFKSVPQRRHPQRCGATSGFLS